MSASNWVAVHIDRIVGETATAYTIEVDGRLFAVDFQRIACWNDYTEGDENVTMSIKDWGKA